MGVRDPECECHHFQVRRIPYLCMGAICSSKTDQMVARHEWKDAETGKVRGVTYAEILSEKALARIDDRYQLAVGDIAKWPVLTKEEFLKPLAWLTPLDARLTKPNRGAVVEEELGADLPEDLSWREGRHVLISADRYDCEMGHKSNPTVEYRKYPDGRIVKNCYAGCEEKIVRRGQDNSVAKFIEDAPPVEVRERPSFPHFTVEDRKLIEEVLLMSHLTQVGTERYPVGRRTINTFTHSRITLSPMDNLMLL